MRGLKQACKQAQLGGGIFQNVEIMTKQKEQEWQSEREKWQNNRNNGETESQDILFYERQTVYFKKKAKFSFEDSGCFWP